MTTLTTGLVLGCGSHGAVTWFPCRRWTYRSPCSPRPSPVGRADLRWWAEEAPPFPVRASRSPMLGSRSLLESTSDGSRLASTRSACDETGVRVEPSAEPVLVTGMPRSGTTWLARELANAPHTALAGREPMNPRGRQYALAGTLRGWVRMETPTRRQTRALAAAYRGRNPWLFSRYGHRQWAAPLSGVRVVVKDPFALLSLPAIVACTGARVVVVYRHPAACLVSYRRMGWSPDLAELAATLETTPAGDHEGRRVRLRPDEEPEEVAMARFWDALYAVALGDLARLPGSLVVRHEDAATHDGRAMAELRDRLGLLPTTGTTRRTSWEPEMSWRPRTRPQLHRLARAPDEAASSWRAGVSDDVVARMEQIAGSTLARLDGMRLVAGDAGRCADVRRSTG